MSSDEILADVATLGRAFVVTVDGPGTGRPLADLAADPSLLRARVLAARGELGTAEDRVAASWVFTGIAARVVAPTLAAVALHGWLPDVAALRWHPWESGLVPPLSLPGPDAGSAAGPRELRDALVAVLGGLVAATRTRTRVAPGLLWGEVAASATKAGAIVERARPGAAEAAVRAVLARDPLARAVRRDPTDGAFRRRTCCLAYRVPGGGTCADCPLAHPIVVDGPENTRAEWSRSRSAPPPQEVTTT